MQDSYALYLVKKGDTVWKIAREVFGLSSNGEIASKVQQLLQSNPHLGNGDRIYPGQLLVLENGFLPMSANALAADLESASQSLHFSGQETQEFAWENFDTLSVFNHEIDQDYYSPVLSGVSSNPSSLASSLGNQFKATGGGFIKISKHLARWTKAGIEGYSQAADGAFGNLLRSSPHAWASLQGDLVRSVSSRARFIRDGSNVIRMLPRDSRAFQIGKRIIVVQPQNGDFLSFSKAVEKNIKLAQQLKQGAKVAGLVFDFGVSGYNIAQDWNTDRRERTTATEAVKLGTKLALRGEISALSAAAATGLCGALTLTTGPGGVACFVVVFGATAWGASETIDWGVERGADMTTYIFSQYSPQTITTGN